MMRMRFEYLFVLGFMVFVSCKREQAEKPKVSYDAVEKENESPKEEENILIADLPLQFDGTNVLIHPVGKYTVSEGLKRYSDDSGTRNNFSISNGRDEEITGFLTNLKFQQIDSDSLVALTDKPIMIERITYLKAFAEKNKKQFLIYSLADMDSNKDGKLDTNDVMDLYCSDITGQNFKKLSPDFHEIIDWKVVEAQKRIYFRTMEDNNKSGAFDKNDKFHYFYVNLLEEETKAIEYFPL